MIGGRFTMRAAVERNTATTHDNWGTVATPTFASVGAPMPCFIWSDNARPLRDGQKTAEIEVLRGMFPLDADLRANDEISAVTNRRGTTIIPGRLRVDGPVQRKHTHLEANLKRIG